MAELEQHKTIMEAVAEVQRAVVVPKGKYNSFGKFYYRSFEDIVAALKEPCKRAGVGFFMSDELVQVGDRYYVKATVCVFFTDGADGTLAVSALAREAEHKNGSDDAQVTGMASSYARKYALCGAFAIDGDSDPDEDAKPEGAAPPEQGPFTAHCQSCGRRYEFQDSAQYMAFVASPSAKCCPAPDWRVEA